MKKNIKLLALILTLIISSCGDDFLDKPPLGRLTAGSFPSNEADAILATNGVYNTLRIWQINTGGFPLLDLMSDDAVKGSNPGDASQINIFDDFTYDAQTINIENWYRTLYLGVKRSHLVIEGVPNADMTDEELRSRLISEARFLRAYFYGILVRAFGDVPKVTTQNPPIDLGRAPVDEIYDEIIIPDLEFAISNLPERSEYAPEDLGRATKGAARALLARLYLFRGDFDNAETYALQVINSGEYDLSNDFIDAFSQVGEFNRESIFEVGALPEGFNEGGNQFGNTQGIRGTPNRGWGFNRPTYDLITFLGDEDPRRDASIVFLGEVLDGITIIGDSDTPDTTYVDASQTQIDQIETYNQKAYHEGAGALESFGHNRRIIRYADVLLMAAEASNENNNPSQALVYLEEVRERARAGNNTILPEITETDKAALRDIILDERRRELALEGLRFWDLVRTNRAIDILAPFGFTAGTHELFPIPQSERDISGGKITQNNGYN